MSTGDQTRVMPALGRPFYLGMLYDCRSDNLVPGVTLWDEETIKEATSRHSKKTDSFSIITEDTVQNKASSLNVEAGLSLSAMGGLVKVSGSAKYMENERTSSRQARVSMHYSMSSHFDQLTMDALASKKIQHGGIFDKDVATHVVTGVEFGVQAFFVFDQQCSSSDSVQDISGKMNVLIEKVPSFKIEGSGSLNMNDEEKKEANKLQCTFIGDVNLDKLPVNFEEAVVTYQHLPEKIHGDTQPGEYPTNVVPQKVWLYPLSKLDDKAAKLVRDISNTLVAQVQNVVEDLQEAELKTYALQEREACRYFSGIKDQLENFARLVSIYKADFLKEIVSLLPAIRGGSKSEEDLAAVLANHNKSVFVRSILFSWLEEIARETDVLGAFIDPLASSGATQFAFSPGQLDKEILRIDIRSVFCLMFNVPENCDPNGTLAKMATEDGKGSQSEPKQNVTLWYQNIDVISEMREKVEIFRNIAEATNKEEENFVFVVSQMDPKTPKDYGATIVCYTGGRPDSQFELPQQPNLPNAFNIQYNFIEVWWPEIPNNSKYKYTELVYQSKDDPPNDWKVKSVLHNVIQVAQSVFAFMTELSADTTYYYKLRAYYPDTGLSIDSERSPPTRTQKDVEKLRLEKTNVGPKEFVRSEEQYSSRYVWKAADSKDNTRLIYAPADPKKNQHQGWLLTGEWTGQPNDTGEVIYVPYNADWYPNYSVKEVMLAKGDWIPLSELYND